MLVHTAHSTSPAIGCISFFESKSLESLQLLDYGSLLIEIHRGHFTAHYSCGTCSLARIRGGKREKMKST